MIILGHPCVNYCNLIETSSGIDGKSVKKTAKNNLNIIYFMLDQKS